MIIRSLSILILAIASFLPQVANAQGNGTNIQPAIYHPGSQSPAIATVVYHRRYHRRHRVRRTITRIGVGAAGGAAIGAVVGGGPGAAIGAVAGAGAGAIYDQHKRHEGH
jgi:outer membrane lipoprotein SlyB